MMNLLEKSRNELIAQSKYGKREKDGKTRYEKRLKSKFASSNRSYNKMDMNKLFKEDILDISIEVIGETDNYEVKISYGGFLEELQKTLKNSNQDDVQLKDIIKSLVSGFNKNDVYIHCSCPDFCFRFQYWATVKGFNSGKPQLVPADETNPDNNLGPGCKHILLLLSNTSWMIKVASVIMNYINYMKKYRERQYADIIYPSIYGKKYTEPVQLSIDDTDELATGTQDIDRSNVYARTKNQFTQGNKQGLRFASRNETDNQETIDDLLNN